MVFAETEPYALLTFMGARDTDIIKNFSPI